jgi:NADH dehydrogenase FAD-containing subunit
VVGGGPTGTEFAAELHDFLAEDVPRLYPELKGIPSITIVQSADHILNTFDKRISEFAEKKFARDGIRFPFFLLSDFTLVSDYLFNLPCSQHVRCLSLE